MLEQKVMDNILKMRIKNVIIASLKTYENIIYLLQNLSNQIFQSIINFSYSDVFSNVKLR